MRMRRAFFRWAASRKRMAAQVDDAKALAVEQMDDDGNRHRAAGDGGGNGRRLEKDREQRGCDQRHEVVSCYRDRASRWAR